MIGTGRIGPEDGHRDGARLCHARNLPCGTVCEPPAPGPTVPPCPCLPFPALPPPRPALPRPCPRSAPHPTSAPPRPALIVANAHADADADACHRFRRLYKPHTGKLTPERKLIVSRRFAEV